MVNTKNGSSKKTDKSLFLGEGPYQSIKLDLIQIIERPSEGEESNQLLFNPRSLDSFDPETMSELRESIKRRGLLHPITVRTKKVRTKTIVELIAGERRLRSIKMLVQDNEEVFDKDSRKMVPAKDFYSHIPCCVHHGISDEEALGLAFEENGKSKPLTIAEEIALVERLILAGYSQHDIAKITGEHSSWVSHTRNFKDYLPKEAYKTLIKGEMTRNVAVNLISYPLEDRKAVFESAKEAAQINKSEKLEKVQDEIEEADDTEKLVIRDKEIAEENGNSKEVEKAEKAIVSAQKKKEKAEVKKQKIEEKKVVITQGDLATGARNANISPKKAKQLSKNDINHLLVKPIDEWIEEGGYQTEEMQLDSDTLMIVKATIESISEGVRNPVELIKNVSKIIEPWDDLNDEDYEYEDEYEDEYEEDLDLVED